MIKSTIVLILVILCCHPTFSTNTENQPASDGASSVESNNESRGILSAIGGGMHDKLRKFVTTVKDILLGHHKKIGGFHYRLKDCFEKIIALERKLLGMKSESASCPDISYLVDKVKEKLYSNDYTVNPHDVQSMAAYLQTHLRSLDFRLQQETKYLNLAFEHIKYLQQFYPQQGARPVYNYNKPPQINDPSIKAREDENH